MDFYDKNDNVVYLKALQYNMANGMKITRIHKGKEAIRKKDKIGSQIWKLTLTFVFGKFLSNSYPYEIMHFPAGGN
jgi:hypothetical protein